jgi:hypothetical protein
MTKQPTRIGDETPVIGGVQLPSSLVNALPDADDAPSDDLGRQAYWLLMLNADRVSLKFRKSDLALMDDDTKRQLIADIQHALGIAPLKNVAL